MYHFSLTGSINKLSEKEAADKMDEISPQWEDEETPFGKLYLGVYDWAYDDKTLELFIPKLRTGGSIQKNEYATEVFKFEIFGDCFLEENQQGVKKIAELKKSS